MQITDFSTSTSATNGGCIFFLRSPFRSRWFLWRTLEFVLVLATDVLVVVKYWSRLTEHMANVLILVIGVLMLMFPYRSLVRTCGELQELCQMAGTWDDEHKSVLLATTTAAQRAIGAGTSRYFTVVWMLIVFVTYCFIRP